MSENVSQSMSAELRQYSNEQPPHQGVPQSYVDGIVGVSGTLTNQVNQNTASLADIALDVKNPPVGLTPAKGDGVTDDAVALQAIINYAGTNKRIVYLPAGTYIVSTPLQLVNGIVFKGAGKSLTTIQKNVASTVGTSYLQHDSILYGYNLNNFSITDLSLIGNRSNYASGNTVTTDGIYLNNCSYYIVENVNILNCNYGYNAHTVWAVKLKQVRALQCQNYAFYMDGSNTSMVHEVCTAWGCLGHSYLSGCVYTTLLNPLADNNNYGGKSDDPFLPQGSGGNYLNYNPLYWVSASSVTIVSPGSENNCTAYMYTEGSNVIVLNPYIYNMWNYSTGGWHFWSTRGTSVSSVQIINPNFQNVINEQPVDFSRKGFYIENPSVQKITLNKFIPMDSSFGSYAYTDGMYYQDVNELASGRYLNGFGATSAQFIPVNLGTYTSGAQTLQFDANNNRQIRFDKGTGNAVSGQPFQMCFFYPLQVKKANAVLKVNIQGTFSGASGYPILEFRKGTNMVYSGSSSSYSISVSGGTINFNTYVTLNNVSTDFVWFNLELPWGDTVVTLTNFEIKEII